MNNKNLKFERVILHKMINSLGDSWTPRHAGEHTEVQLRQRSMTFPRIKTEHQFKRNQETYIQPGKCLLKWYQISARRTLLGNSQIMAIMMVRRCSLCAPTTRGEGSCGCMLHKAPWFPGVHWFLSFWTPPSCFNASAKAFWRERTFPEPTWQPDS